MTTKYSETQDALVPYLTKFDLSSLPSYLLKSMSRGHRVGILHPWPLFPLPPATAFTYLGRRMR